MPWFFNCRSKILSCAHSGLNRTTLPLRASLFLLAVVIFVVVTCRSCVVVVSYYLWSWLLIYLPSGLMIIRKLDDSFITTLPRTCYDVTAFWGVKPWGVAFKVSCMLKTRLTNCTRLMSFYNFKSVFFYCVYIFRCSFYVSLICVNQLSFSTFCF